MVQLSKSLVVAGAQCHKLLWWMVNEPGAIELQLDARQHGVLDQGAKVGELATAYVPGGTLIQGPWGDRVHRIAATREALASGAPVIYEAAFEIADVSVSVDVLERQGAGSCLTEVKSTTSVKKHHLTDVAVQTHVVRASGLELRRLEVMHLNRDCAYPNLSNLFVRQDVSEQVQSVLPTIPREIAAQIAMLDGPLPQVAIGDHCYTPYECPFTKRCWPVLPPHPVSTLYAMRSRCLELDEQGYRTIHDLPEDVPLGPIADRQRRAVQEGRIIAEPTLARALDPFVSPIAFLDFETVALAIPAWEGCHPYDAVPAQFSCHVQDTDGRVTHHEWLAEGPEDPRPMLAERLVRACDGARTVVAYNAGFEGRCIQQMADVLPALTAPLRSMATRLVDLLPVIRNHVYHPDFDGSFSLKRVLPTLVPEFRYEDLAINEGQMASLELERLLFRGPELAGETKAQLRGDLLRYCHQDTWGLVKLLRRLRELARA